MADKKISALTAITTPLAGTEVLPIVQSSTTKKVSVIELQAAPVSAGIANSVNYLNASKIPSTVSTFSFDGTNFGVGTASPSTYGQLAVVGSGAPTAFVGGNVNAGNAAVGIFKFGSTAASNAFIDYGGQIASYTLGGVDQCDLRFYTSNGSTSVERWRINPTGNLVAASAGLGIDFSATPGTGTSELLADYEEGTWTPTGNGVTYTGVTGTYTKIGRIVTVFYAVTVPITADTEQARLGGLPFTPANTTSVVSSGAADLALIVDGNTFARFANLAVSAYKTNVNLSGLTLTGQITYHA
jgi:hypothetical protein